MIKKIVPSLLLVLLITACSQERRWNDQQRAELRRELKEYRYYDYLANMSDSEFDVFTTVVSDSLEAQYPNYKQFSTMPGVGDTITTVIFSSISYDLSADYQNMRYLYPYDQLKKEGFLPKGLTKDDMRNYYSCLAQKINANYPSMVVFLETVISGDTAQINTFKRQCGAPFKAAKTAAKSKK